MTTRYIPYIIAEIGVNHNGSMKIAKELMNAAKNAGANAVKFQTFHVDDIADEHVAKADYQKNHSNETQYSMLKKYEVKGEDFKKLHDYSKKISIDFLSTACDIKSLNFLVNELKLKSIKIASPDITNIQLLLHVGRSKRNIILSSGMSTLKDIDIALSALCYGYHFKDFKFNPIKHHNLYRQYSSYLKNKVQLLHCTTEYPAPLNELNLNVIDVFKERYEMKIGYSDHSCNLSTSIIATTKQVNLIEVHITLDNNLSGPDHKSSLNIKMFSDYVKKIKQTNLMLGTNKKIITESEVKNAKAVKKYLYYSRDAKSGEVVSDDMILCKRSNSGISSKDYSKVLGRFLNKGIKGNTRISFSHLRK